MEVFEAVMMVCFGLSWPLSVYKSWTSRTARGKSLFFEIFIWLGYVSGITGKILSGRITWVIAVYVLNIVMVSADILLYFRNTRLDRAAGRAADRDKT